MLSVPSQYWLIALICASEVFSVWLVARLWRSDDHLFFKVTLSVLGFVPLLGPLVILWISNFPPVQPPALRDQRGGTDVFERWHLIFAEKNAARRFHWWRATMEDNADIHASHLKTPGEPESRNQRRGGISSMAIVFGLLTGVALGVILVRGPGMSREEEELRRWCQDFMKDHPDLVEIRRLCPKPR